MAAATATVKAARTHRRTRKRSPTATSSTSSGSTIRGTTTCTASGCPMATAAATGAPPVATGVRTPPHWAPGGGYAGGGYGGPAAGGYPGGGYPGGYGGAGAAAGAAATGAPQDDGKDAGGKGKGFAAKMGDRAFVKQKFSLEERNAKMGKDAVDRAEDGDEYGAEILLGAGGMVSFAQLMLCNACRHERHNSCWSRPAAWCA